MIMKESHNATLCDSESYGKETNPLVFGVKEVYQLDDSHKGVDESKIVAPVSNDDGSGRVDFVTNEVPDEISLVSGEERDGDYECSKAKDVEKLISSPSLSNAGDFILCKESEPTDSGTLPMTKFDSLEIDKNPCMVKSVLECPLPELIVCDKKINDQNVKDICIDEGMPTKDKKRFDENDYGNAEVNDEKVPIQSIPDMSFDRDSSQNCEAENSMQTEEAVSVTSGMIDADKESLANRKLPVRELSTRTSLMSLFSSLDGEEGKFVQPHSQISAANEVSESSTSLPAEVESTTSNQQADISSNSNLDERAGSSNFSRPAPGGTSNTIGQIKNEVEQPLESSGVDGTALEEQALDHDYVNSDHSSETSQAHPITSSESRTKNTLTEPLDQERIDKSNELSESSEVQTSASSKNQISNIKDDQPIQPSVMKHERKNSNDASAVSSQLLYPEETPNFPAAGLITYSGPIAYSGSLSLRSDGSAASGKSFAFPVLPSEWNSSPVRMAKADRRYYQKQKSWRSGIFCCRF